LIEAVVWGSASIAAKSPRLGRGWQKWRPPFVTLLTSKSMWKWLA